MIPVDPERLAAVRAAYGHCFGCGLDNPIGLQVTGFERNGDTVRAGFTPRGDYAGFHGILHGQLLACR